MQSDEVNDLTVRSSILRSFGVRSDVFQTSAQSGQIINPFYELIIIFKAMAAGINEIESAPTLQQAPTSIKSNLGFCTVPKSSRKKADFRQGSLLKRLLLRPKSAKTSKSGRSMSFGFLLFSFSFFLNTFLSLRVFI
ncbi:uncharacterized protein LOC136025937 [Artemia franciscana]|uniref:uncharacterized protein LOC136025937 n=1 Tax=Artemia franciscana TaxID=6661 RepID=UPI0032DAE93C